jgi:hypothetical protein
MTESAFFTDETEYGRPISPNRQEELNSLLARNEPRPFAGVKLSGADVSWLLGACVDRPPSLEGAQLFGAHLENAPLARVCFKQSNLIRAHLERADLSGADLTGADLAGAYLLGADLSGADLAGADLSVAVLQGTVLVGANLEATQLYGVRFDGETRLAGVRLGPGRVGDWLDRPRLVNRNAGLVGIQWQGANLESVPWNLLRRLGGERWALHRGRLRETVQFVRLALRPGRHFMLARAYRQMANELQKQGLLESAQRFAGQARKQERYALLARTCRRRSAVGHVR